MAKSLSELTPELKCELFGIALVTAAVLTLASLAGLSIGPAGVFVAKILRYSLGAGAPVLPLLVLAIGSRYVWTRKPVRFTLRFWGVVLVYVAALAIYHHFVIPAGREVLPESLTPGGGLVGGMVLFSLRKLFGVWGSLIVLVGVALSSLLLATAWSLGATLLAARDKAGEGLTSAREAVAATLENARAESAERDRSFYNQERDKPPVFEPPAAKAEPQFLPDPEPVLPPPLRLVEKNVPQPLPAPESLAHYSLPPLSLLRKPSKSRSLKTTKELADNARLLESTLEDFGVGARVLNAYQGPAVTRYELEPAAGVKVSRIVSLSDDIALKLAAHGVRMEAPIPGKAAIGIEVPNKEITPVSLREVVEGEEFQRGLSRLTVALGKDIAGQPIVADLAKMPHLLVAGATGSGKSVCINTLIVSILLKARPDEVKFLLVDPKVVELSNYNGIPHLLTPVVTDCKKAASALRWAVGEMERRYQLFAAAGVRDFARYNELLPDERLPLILIIIDELADLMMVAPVDVEDAICRLAQMARAAGLHLVLATQRPSVDVITGTIKANIPSRISFAVSSQVDSRTILDMAGAEKLLGKGDMLFYPVGAPKPLRVQGAFITDTEVEELVAYLKEQTEPEYAEGVTNFVEYGDRGGREAMDDELLEEAVRMVLETGQASVSMLQRKFRVGYTRAARLIDMMEEMKIVGPNIGSKAREILMTTDQVNNLYFRKD